MKTTKNTKFFKEFYTGTLSRDEELKFLESDDVDQLMRDQWEHPEEMAEKTNAPDFEKIFGRIEKQTNRKLSIWNARGFQLVAGIALLMGISTVLYLGLQKNQESQTFQVVETKNEIMSLTLPDGSTVWLGENSRISYPDNFIEGRLIEMEGLVYYKVLKNNTFFIVKTGDLSIEVTGTSFSVSNYPSGKEISTTLEEGIVVITDQKGTIHEELSANQMLNFSKATGTYSISNVNAKELNLWKESKLVFNNTSVTDIVVELKKRFGYVYQIDKKTEAQKFTFTITNETLKETLDLISAMAPIEIRQSNDTISFISR